MPPELQNAVRSILQLDKILLDPSNKNDLQTLLQAFEEHDQKLRRAQIVFVPIWYITFSISVITGLSGAGILMFSFIKSLLS